MESTTVPVTTGGNRRRMYLKNSPNTTATMPPITWAPKMAPMPPMPATAVRVGT